MRRQSLIALVLSCLACCGLEEPRQGYCIIACGQPIPVGTRVVLWDEEQGYNAYSDRLHFAPPAPEIQVPAAGTLRYEPGRRRKGPQEEQLVKPGSRNLLALQATVDQFVLHYDACGLASRCFLVLHDRRALSAHFLLDVDGTIYQTLDLRERAWHAGSANTRSIGIEIANIGSRRLDDQEGLAEIDAWYERDSLGLRLRLPDWADPASILTEDFVAYSAREERIEGRVQGEERAQYDFTKEQYAALVKLAAALCRTLPRIQADAPRGPDGEILDSVLDPQTLEQFRGILGHHHISRGKQDPGPAFAWERFLHDLRVELDA